MSNPVGSSLALTSIADGSQIVAADHRNNYGAIQTEVNDLVACLSGGVAGQILQAVSSSAVDWNGGTYQAYTPTWTASGTAPAIGNATVAAFYTQVGKLTHAYGRILFGSTSTYGTGNYSFALPTTFGGTIANTVLGTAFLGHSTSMGEAVIRLAGTTAMQFYLPATYLGSLAIVGQTVPFTWASGDAFEWSIVYSTV